MVTVALITGIYGELLESIKSIDGNALKNPQARGYRCGMARHQWHLVDYPGSGYSDECGVAGWIDRLSARCPRIAAMVFL